MTARIRLRSLICSLSNCERKQRMIYDFQNIDFNNIPECLNKVIALLAEAGTLMAALIDMPFAEPDDPRWDEFQKRPHIHELVDVFSSVFDAEKLTKKTLAEIDGTKSTP